MGTVEKRGKQRASTGKRPRVAASPLDEAQGYEIAWSQVCDLFDAARPYDGCHFVYILGEEDGGHIKIGTSRNPIHRLRNMQVGNPRRLRVEYALLGGYMLEKFLHGMWDAYAVLAARKRGQADPATPGTEWFRAEIRDKLFPIVDLAVAGQIQRLREKTDVTEAEMQNIVRIAHAAHGVEENLMGRNGNVGSA